MATSVKNTLRALLLALFKYEENLKPEECAALADISETLMYVSECDVDSDVDPWVLIEQDIETFMTGNSTLQELYQESITQLENCYEILPWPTLAAVEQAIPSESNEPKNFSHFSDLARTKPSAVQHDRSTQELINSSLKILDTPHPEQSVKKLSRLQKVLNYFKSRYK
ncbi:hypothetical protein PMG71_04600 [Roseofilum sp. BLCC_M154]|uniref:Uncharacterized protein n=1 Tax=Roseofilum acuticapitatum BLCC-M154 TaxID=3022444 RepID=A0ABT7AP73_9CYAN|nr:hypothetical protein [Roseofilum acuticapitatum]MDJ1168699.1 hypothetical protein [Roseofilum acuticapitatum BLCC-M154]